MLRKILVILLLLWPLGLNAGFTDCSDNWMVTGYYVLREDEYSGEKIKVELTEGGDRMVREDFMEDLFVQASGILDNGEIIEYYWDDFHINDKPEDYFGGELTINTVAVDPEVVSLHSRLIIPSLPPPFNTRIYTALDIGLNVKGKHLDVFMGEGEAAFAETKKFIEMGNKACVEVLSDSSSPKASEGESVETNTELTNRLAGRILLQVEENGEAWYVYPRNQKRYYLGRPAVAFHIMRELGLGATHEFISSHTLYPDHVLGMILLDVEMNGEAYYINPIDRKAYYLGRPTEAFQIMRELGLGITNSDLSDIVVESL